MTPYESWGKYPRVKQTALPIYWTADRINQNESQKSLLPFGMGRSYGDSCLNDQGCLISTRGLNRFISLDEEKGLLRCESGVTFEEILQLIVPRGWFLPVTPGTKFVTVGGAVANDIHGKNHHRAGTFGCHVTQFELLRSDGTRLVCTPTENKDFFEMTIGGLGLTGVILWAEFKLKPISSSYIDQEIIKFSNLDEFFELNSASDKDFEYTVSWIDCLSKRKSLGRGLFIRGNHADGKKNRRLDPGKTEQVGVPFNAPNFFLNRFSVKVFNTLFYKKQFRKKRSQSMHYTSFFYPLDSLANWNNIYGKRGFFQYQCVVPKDHSKETIRTILEKISDSGQASFLSVLKEFGNIKSPGFMSFPKAGITFALDFPNRGDTTFKLLEDLDTIVKESGGSVYPAKDARMSAKSFGSYYPQWTQFKEYIDPKFSSSFWRRVTKDE